MKNKNKIPCKNCLCLVKCIHKYRNYYDCTTWPVLRLMDCSILKNTYYDLPVIAENAKNAIDIWWEKNNNEKKRK